MITDNQLELLEIYLSNNDKRLFEINKSCYIKRVYISNEITFECNHETNVFIAENKDMVRKWILKIGKKENKSHKKAYGYIRVSTEKQDYQNQKYGILEYANANNINDVEFIEETISSRKKLEDRLIWDLVNNRLGENDILITSELSRFGRSTLEVMHLFKLMTERKIKAHVIKNNIKLNEDENKITNQVLIFAFGLAAEIERDLISSRTKEALALRKAKGVKLGRKPGQQVKSKLDDKKDEIIDLLSKGVNITAISKIFECGRTTMDHYIISRKLKERAKLLGKTQKDS